MKKYLFALITALVMADALAILNLEVDEEALYTPVSLLYKREQVVNVSLDMFAAAGGLEKVGGEIGASTAFAFLTPGAKELKVADWKWAPASEINFIIAAGVPLDLGPATINAFSGVKDEESETFGYMFQNVINQESGEIIGKESWNIVPQDALSPRDTFLAAMKGGLMRMRHKAFGAFSDLNPAVVRTLCTAQEDIADIRLDKLLVKDALELIVTVMGGKKTENGFELKDAFVSRKTHVFTMPNRKKMKKKTGQSAYQNALRRTLRDAMTAMNISVVDGKIVQGDYATFA